MFIETSAKAGHNVKTLFKRIAQGLPGMETAQEPTVNMYAECGIKPHEYLQPLQIEVCKLCTFPNATKYGHLGQYR
jgi:hypothetical protein